MDSGIQRCVRRVSILVLGLGIFLPSFLSGQEGGVAGPPDSAEGVVRELYDIVTFPAGTSPDWDRARSLFLPEAVVVLRSSRTAQSVMSVEGWIQDFETFIESADVIERGFSEAIVRTHTTVFGDIAQVWVLYEAGFPDDQRPPQQGVDCFGLVRYEGSWLISSILNEIPTPARPIPGILREGG